MKKLIIPSISSGISMLVVGLLISYLFNLIFPSLKSEYEGSYVIRSWKEPIMQLFFLSPFLLGFLLSYIWDKAKELFIEETYIRKAISYGLLYWAVTIPGMVLTFSTFRISLLMVASWSVITLFQSLAAGFVNAKLNK